MNSTMSGWQQQARAEFGRQRARAVAALAYLFLGAGALWLVSAIGKDSHYWYDTVEQSTNAAVGVALLGIALPFGVWALFLDRKDQHLYAPGETALGLRRPRQLLGCLVVAAIAMLAVTAVLLGWLP